jgi:hypothetical protein
LSTAVLADLRVLTGARVVYALSAPKVAGSVTQTGLYDYRLVGDVEGGEDDQSGKGVHFGPPVTSTEILFRDKGNLRSDDSGSRGEVSVLPPLLLMLMIFVFPAVFFFPARMADLTADCCPWTLRRWRRGCPGRHGPDEEG